MVQIDDDKVDIERMDRAVELVVGGLQDCACCSA